MKWLSEWEIFEDLVSRKAGRRYPLPLAGGGAGECGVLAGPGSGGQRAAEGEGPAGLGAPLHKAGAAAGDD